MLRIRKPLAYREYRGEICLISFGDDPVSIHADYVEELKEILLAESLEDEPLILIDMQNVDFICSSFLELLIRVWNRIKDRDYKSLCLSGLDPLCREVLDVTHLTSVIHVYDDCHSAITAMNKGQRSCSAYMRKLLERSTPY